MRLILEDEVPGVEMQLKISRLESGIFKMVREWRGARQQVLVCVVL